MPNKDGTDRAIPMELTPGSNINAVKAPTVIWRVILLFTTGFIIWGLVIGEFFSCCYSLSSHFIAAISLSILHLVLLAKATLKFSNNFNGIDPDSFSELQRQPSSWAIVIAIYINALALIYFASQLEANIYVLSLILVSGAAIIAILPLIAVIFIITVSTLIFHVITPADFSPIYSIFVMLQQLTLVVLTLSALKEQKSRELLARSHQELHATQLLLEASAERNERRKLSMDLHDQMGHTLMGINLNLQFLKQTLEGEPVCKVDNTLDMVKDLTQTLRNMVSEMRETSQIDLKQAIEQLTSATPGLKIELDIDTSIIFSSPLAETIYRCCQESITNVLRYSKATTLAIAISENEGLVSLKISDNGQGMQGATPGNGLTGMKERVEHLCGSLLITEAADSGVCININIPKHA